jgi:hypothetical protein
VQVQSVNLPAFRAVITCTHYEQEAATLVLLQNAAVVGETKIQLLSDRWPDSDLTEMANDEHTDA